MTKRLYLLLQVTCLFISSAAFSATLKGKVTDDKGEPLPYATVYVKGTTIGTAANANAEYTLQLQPGTYNVLCQYMGFKQTAHKVTVKGAETITHNFSLQEQSMEMKDVVVKANAEDPAYAIMRKTIKKRKHHLEQVKEFQSSIYMKAVGRNSSLPTKIFGIKIDGEDISEGGGGGADSTKLGVLYLSEQEADYYTDGKRERTVVKSVRQSGTESGVGLAQVPPVVSYYNNNVNPLWDISERGFISPVSDGALNYYKYKYEGEFREDGHTINKIKVMPKRDYEPLFTGTIYIIEDEWAIHSLDLTLTKKSGMQMLDTLTVRQSYIPLKKDLWIIKSQVQYFTLNFFGIGLTGNILLVYDNQKVNEKMPDSLFDNKIISSYASGANDKDTGYWETARMVPLEEDEAEDYQKKDSARAVYTSPEYRDSMRRKGNKFEVMDFIMSGFYHAAKEYKSTYKSNSLLGGMVTYNTVEGIVVNPKINSTHRIDSSRYIYNVTAVRYGFGNTHLNAYDRLSFKKYDRSWLTRNWEAGIEGGKYIYQFNPNSTVMPLYNTVSILGYGKNLMKLYERYTAAAFFNRQFGNGLNVMAKGGFQRRLPVSNTTFYTWANNNPEKWTDNTPAPLAGMLWEVHNAVLFKAGISYQPGYKFIQYPKFKSPVSSIWPRFTLMYEKGIPGILNSKTDFDKWRFQVEDYVNMKLFGSFEYNLATGGFLNNRYVSLPDMMHIADNEIAIAAPYLAGFQLAPYYMFSNTANIYGEAHVEYDLNGLLTNKIPLLKRARWNVVVGNNTLYINPNNYYTEAFVGIDNLGFSIFRFLRVDVVRGWDHNRKTYTGIRIGLDANAMGGGVSIEEDKENFNW
ncbi:MAG: carboxypeptidase-like regulatory domain-containing protein [Taibaiella sp.]|nr:carboxypeptidase-like regulatory domain-containing protein [Taibaiella sp.]